MPAHAQGVLSAPASLRSNDVPVSPACSALQGELIIFLRSLRVAKSIHVHKENPQRAKTKSKKEKPLLVTTVSLFFLRTVQMGRGAGANLNLEMDSMMDSFPISEGVRREKFGYVKTSEM